MSTQDDLLKSSEDSMFAQLTVEGPHRVAGSESVFLKIAVPATASNIRMKYDPVSMEQAQQTRELNRSVRLGFVPPVVSTR